MKITIKGAFVKHVNRADNGKQYLTLDCPSPDGRSYDVSLQTSSLQIDWTKLTPRTTIDFVALARPFTWVDKKLGNSRLAFDCSQFELAKT